MCCIPCVYAEWIIGAPIGFAFLALIFLPGFLLIRELAKRIDGWGRLPWIPGWGFSGLIAALLVEVPALVSSRELIALNIHNGILAQEAGLFRKLMIALIGFGLASGICHFCFLASRKMPGKPSA